jgi:phosphoglycolate phosphatase
MPSAAAIFDLDGTLINSLRDIGEAMNRTLSTMGFPVHAMEKYNYFVGEGVRQLVQRALPADQQSDATITTFLAAYRADYGQHWHDHTAPYPGIPALLEALVERRIPIGVLSNKPDAVTRLCVEHFFPHVPFIAVAGQKEDVPRKPDPAAAWAIAEGMNVPPERCVFIGDTATDMQTAVAAGMFPAGVTWGFRPRTELLDTGARLIADQPEALLGLFTDRPVGA